MLQFQSLLAMSSALPNMTPKDMAAFCGLGASDLAGLAAYTNNISSLTPSSLASMGITSSQLNSLAQIASLTGANPQTIAAQAKKQGQFEQEYLRQLNISLGASSTATTTSPQQKAQVAQKQNMASKQGQKVSSSASSLPIKQTVQFKNKQQQQQMVQKKNLNKVVGLSSKPSSPIISSVAQKLNSSGVTISKPPSSIAPHTSKASPSIPKPQARNSPSPVVRPNIPQGISITKQPKNQNLAKKFPHLNITNVEEPPSNTLQSKPTGSSPSTIKPGLSVKPSSQLLKPHAAAQANIAKAQTPKSSIDAKNKLALFKAQMKKSLNVPGTAKKPAQSNTAQPRPASAAPRPASAAPRPASAASATKQNNAAAAAAAAKKKPQPKPKPNEVICIDID